MYVSLTLLPASPSFLSLLSLFFIFCLFCPFFKWKKNENILLFLNFRTLFFGFQRHKCVLLPTFVTEFLRFLSLVTPDVPNNVKAIITYEKCLHINWDQIESGKCRVSNNIKYIYGKNSVFIGNQHGQNYTDCSYYIEFGIISVALNAKVNDLSSNFSENVFVQENKRKQGMSVDNP